MKRKFLLLSLIAVAIFTGGCSRHSRPQGQGKMNDRQRAKVYSDILGFEVTKRDDLYFYGEVVSWLRTPYRPGGTTHAGVDCSGLIWAVYRDLYRIPTHRTVKTILDNDVRTIAKRSAKTGDLIFLQWPGNRNIGHVGIYLKDGYFVHASSTRGVVIDNLNQKYYKESWRKTGRVKALK